MHAPCLALLPPACPPAGPAKRWLHALHACSCDGGRHALPLQPSRHSLIAEGLHIVGFQQAASGLPCSWGLLLAHACSHLKPHPLAACFCRVTSATKP